MNRVRLQYPHAYARNGMTGTIVDESPSLAKFPGHAAAGALTHGAPAFARLAEGYFAGRVTVAWDDGGSSTEKREHLVPLVQA